MLLFVRNVSELEHWGTKVTEAMAHDGLLWIAYPKKSSKAKSDLNRDAGCDVITKAGSRCVAQIAIDETWSGLAFPPDRTCRHTPQGPRGQEALTDSAGTPAMVNQVGVTGSD